MMHSSSFSAQGYEHFIDAFLEAGYRFSHFNEFSDSESMIALFRHDVDVDIWAALELAKLENKKKIGSTFCFTISSPYYNLFARDERQAVQQIIDLGHDVALHYDSSLYEDFAEGLSTEMEIFSAIFPKANSKVYSLHRPRTLLTSQPVDRLMNLSSNILWGKNVFYVSDSTGQWLYGHPLKSPEFLKGKNLQVLTHPIWWIKNGNNQLEKLHNSLLENHKGKIQALKSYLPKLFNSLKETEVKNV